MCVCMCVIDVNKSCIVINKILLFTSMMCICVYICMCVCVCMCVYVYMLYL